MFRTGVQARAIVGILAILLAMLHASAFYAQTLDSAVDDRPRPQGLQLDLTKLFQTRSRWRLVVTEGPPTTDYGGGDAPGALTLCLHRGAGGPCISDLVTPPKEWAGPAEAWRPHYLHTAKAVYPHGRMGEPLLLLKTGSLNSGDGDQIEATQLLAYDRGADVFRRVFSKSVGRNNNQEIRFVTEGPLQGRIITAEPQSHPPYGYWIEVYGQSSDGRYRRIVRYGSATRYDDGNALAVVDSETPSIERRLGLWKPSQPLSGPESVSPGKRCLKPRLIHDELWCR